MPRFYGSTGAMTLNQPVVGMAATPSGQGYWLVAADGGIFSFGDARFYGSTGAMTLNRPVVGMAANPDGQGYWLVASDGGIFSFGDAPFYGSTGAVDPQPAGGGHGRRARRQGYWLVASDGGIFSFGDAPFYGSGGGTQLGAAGRGHGGHPDGNGLLAGARIGIAVSRQRSSGSTRATTASTTRLLRSSINRCGTARRMNRATRPGPRQPAVTRKPSSTSMSPPICSPTSMPKAPRWS